MSKSVESLTPDLLGKTLIVQSFERGGLDPNDLTDMTKWVGVLTAFGIGPAATMLYFEGVNAPVTLRKDLYVEYYVAERGNVPNE